MLPLGYTRAILIPATVAAWQRTGGRGLSAPEPFPCKLLGAASVLAAALLGAVARGENPPPAPPPPEAPRPAEPAELPRDVQGVLARGLAWLASRQIQAGQRGGVYLEGSWEGGEHQVAVTALAGLALLASGSTPTSGPYALHLQKAIDFLTGPRCRTRWGLIRFGNDSRPMYGHGFSTLFLAECYGMGAGARERDLRDTLRKAVQAIAASQSRDGGWYYFPPVASAVDSPDIAQDEGSVTITQIQALRAARNAGIKVDRRVVERAVDYVRRSQDADGGVRYTVRYGRSSLALTAAGLSVLHGAGDYESDNAKRALAYVRSHMDADGEASHFHYTHFYAAQAMFQQGGEDWASYFPRIRDELVRQARDDGAKSCYWTSSYGEAYATALALLILELPYRYLPIYER
jgi:hypothetical protein